jgi:protein-L-isoaspartate(D-aspartate) O-methyltransferase
MDQASTTQLADYASARDHMVDGQVRPNKVIDPRIIRAMRSIPRERFVPPHLVSLAYVDEDVPLDRGRALMEPMVIARLVQLARVRQGDRVLVVGAGSGYGAALMAACGGQVTALEEDEALLAIARRTLPEFAPGAALAVGPLAAGQAAGAPWDVILIEGAVRAIPATIALQLNPNGGRLVTVLTPGNVTSGGQGVLAEPGQHNAPSATLRAAPMFDCATPLLPPLLPARAFQF